MAIHRVRRIMRRQRGLVLLFVSLFLIAGVPLSPARAQSLDCTQVVPVIPNQFPAWSDGSSGWDQAPYYSTIQTADIDLDGQAELLARGRGHPGQSL